MYIYLATVILIGWYFPFINTVGRTKHSGFNLSKLKLKEPGDGEDFIEMVFNSLDKKIGATKNTFSTTVKKLAQHKFSGKVHGLDKVWNLILKEPGIWSCGFR